MKLHELKNSNLGIRLIDLDRIAQVGRLAFKMGMTRSANPYKLGAGHDNWQRGYDAASRDWDTFLQRNGGRLW